MNRHWKILAALTFLPLLAFGPDERVAPTRWALLVGISDYIHFDDVEGGDLPGAERDARAVRDVLVSRWGFPEENVRLLLNAEATGAAIESGLRDWLQNSVRPGDEVIFYFAGHGSQIWDENGDEDDGLDETIAPADVDPMNPDFDIVDEVLGEWLRALPTSNVQYVHDNCNAGTGTRDVTPFSRARKLARDPNDLPGAGSTGRRALPGQDEDTSGFDFEGVDILEIGASQPNQAAVDAYFEGTDGSESFHGGAFTTFLVQQLWRAEPGTTYREVFQEVREALRKNRFNQDPYLSESSELAAAPIFFVEGATNAGAVRGLPIVSVDGMRAEIGAGLALGLTRGSELVTEDGARIRITSASRDRAEGDVLGGSVAEGDRAMLDAYVFPEIALRVNVGGVDSETVESLRSELGEAPVRIVEDPDGFGHVLLRRRGTEVRVLGQDGFERHVVEAGENGTGELAERLRQEAASLALSEMDNLGQSFAVKVWMTDDRTRFGLGEMVTFSAKSERDGYLTLVDLGTDGSVTVLFPNPYETDNRVSAGQTIEFPSAAMDFEIVAQPPAGRGMVRAFLTPEPLDLPLGDDFTSGDVLLADRITEALQEAAGRRTSGAVDLSNWGTAALVYDITR